MEIRSLGYRTDLLARRLAGARITDRGEYVAVHTPRNPTFWWGNFVLVPGPLRPGDGARALAAFDREHPGARHLAIGVDTTDGAVGEAGELHASGASTSVACVLTARTLRAPPRPAAAEIRPLRSDEDWRQAAGLRIAVAHAEENAGAAHLMFLRRSVEEARRLAERGHGWRFGAFVDGRVCSSLGVVLDERGLARYQVVETHPEHRRRGLAGTLVHQAGLHALRAGARRLVIVADRDGDAIGIYRSVGFRRREHQVALEAPERRHEPPHAQGLRE